MYYLLLISCDFAIKYELDIFLMMILHHSFIHWFIVKVVYSVPLCCPCRMAQEVEVAERWQEPWWGQVEAEAGVPPEGLVRSASSHRYRRPAAPAPPGHWPDLEWTSHRSAGCGHLFSASHPGSEWEKGGSWHHWRWGESVCPSIYLSILDPSIQKKLFYQMIWYFFL